jgi:MIP family channel proteins
VTPKGSPPPARAKGSRPVGGAEPPRRDTSAKARPAAAGLYGSELGGRMLRTATAEYLGTLLLVLVGTSVATTSVLDSGTYTAGFVGLAFGLALTALVAGLGHVSGCHVNPAVTLGLAATRQFPWRFVPAYVGAQLAGAITASLIVWAGYGDRARDIASLGAAAPAPGVTVARALLIEVVITFLLVFVVCSVATDERVPRAVAPIAVGFALAAAVYVGVPVTGGAVNPARAFGPFLVSGTFPMWGVYLLGPLLGGVFGAVTYDRVVRQTSAPTT